MYEYLDGFAVTEGVTLHNNNSVLLYTKDGDIYSVLFAVRRLDDNYFYIVYSLYSYSSDAFISDTNYEVALIDYDGNIIKHVDTDIPVHLSKHFYYSVTMRYDEKLNRLFIVLGARSITFEVDGDSFKIENVANNVD